MLMYLTKVSICRTAYLDEFVFRFKRRKTPMAAFQALLGVATCKSPQTLADMGQP